MTLFSSSKRQTAAGSTTGSSANPTRLRSSLTKGSSTIASAASTDSPPSSPLPEAGSSSHQGAASSSPPPRPPRLRPPAPRDGDDAAAEDSLGDDGGRPEDDELLITCHARGEKASFSFVCLGVGGGPLESDCSCYVVKAADRHWRQGMYVLEGGSWLGALSRVCSDNLRKAFYDFDFSHSDASLRAGEIGSYAKAFLISHAHLDHILGMVLGSASLPGKRAVYGLKSTLENLLGIFDGKLWPKLASFREDDPFIVYHFKPVESQAVLNLDDSISVLPFALSHGLNPSNLPAPPTPTPTLSLSPRGSYFSKRYSLPLGSLMPTTTPLRQTEVAGGASAGPLGGEKPVFTSPFAPSVQFASTDARQGDASGANSPSPSDSSYYSSAAADPESPTSTPAVPPSPAFEGQRPAAPKAAALLKAKAARRPKTASGSERAGKEGSSADEPLPPGRRAGAPHRVSIDHGGALDSTAFFLTNKRTGHDVLFFGDVEPDCVSRAPRNKRIWQHTASRFAVGKLTTMFLECSFPAAHPTEFLWGHLSVNHLYDELKVLARCVKSERAVLARRHKAASTSGSRKGSTGGNGGASSAAGGVTSSMVPPSPLSVPDSAELRGTLSGLNVVVIHVKQALFPSVAEGASKSTDSGSSGGGASSTSSRGGNGGGGRMLDPRTMQERILQELEELDVENGLGVRFIIAKQGMRLEI